MPNDEDEDKTPTASPLAKKHPSSTHHLSLKSCPHCLGKDIECKVCSNEHYTNDPIKYSTWDLRKTLLDYNNNF